MAESTVTCSKCGHQFSLTEESLAGPVLANLRRHYEDQIAREREAMAAGPGIEREVRAADRERIPEFRTTLERATRQINLFEPFGRIEAVSA